jgi:membrane protein implicated in regulation of membrane protease activity
MLVVLADFLMPGLHVCVAQVAPDTSQKLRYALLALATLVLLFLTFALGVLLARALRRSRERLERKPPGPTEYVDAWSMHKLPEEPGPSDGGDDHEDNREG